MTVPVYAESSGMAKDHRMDNALLHGTLPVTVVALLRCFVCDGIYYYRVLNHRDDFAPSSALSDPNPLNDWCRSPGSYL